MQLCCLVHLLHLKVGSLQQTQFSSSQFCHGLHLLSQYLLSRLTQSIHLCFGLPILLLSSTLYSAPSYSRIMRRSRWYHLQSFLKRIIGLASLRVQPPQSRFPAPLCDILYLQSLPSSLSVFFYVTSSLFLWELVIGTVSIPYWLNNYLMYGSFP